MNNFWRETVLGHITILGLVQFWGSYFLKLGSQCKRIFYIVFNCGEEMFLTKDFFYKFFIICLLLDSRTTDLFI